MGGGNSTIGKVSRSDSAGVGAGIGLGSADRVLSGGSISKKKKKRRDRKSVVEVPSSRNTFLKSEALLPLHFSETLVAETLHDAVSKRNEELVIQVFFKYADAEYVRLSSTFQKRYSIDIVTLSFQQIGEDVSECVRLRLEPRINSICRRINVDLKEKPDDYVMTVFEIILGYWELDLNELKAAFQLIHKVPLKSALRQNIKEAFVVDILSAILDEGAINDSSAMVKDSIDGLMRAIRSNDLFEGDRFFFKLICSRSREQLKDIFEGFLQTYQHDITTVIHRHYTSGGPGSTRDYLDAITRVLRHGQTYFCNQIQATLKLPNSDQTKNRKLIFAIMSRTDYALREIKNEYRKSCFQLLIDDIKENVENPAVRLALVKVLSQIN